MSEDFYRQSPDTWAIAPISDIAEINPQVDKSCIADDLEVSFVPMPAVEAQTGRIDVSAKRRFHEVKKGYTPFCEKDILFAKITPCMENGKMAVVPSLRNGLGFGSTEFHVLRVDNGIIPKYLYYFLASKHFRVDAEHNMTGAVGQRRVPAAYLSQHQIPIPPTNEQRRIVAKLEELFSELDKGIENLKTARAQLKVYRQAVLKHAFEGKLTAKWREENKDELETPEQLLARIQQEREARYQQQLEEWKAAAEAWEKNGREGKRPVKPKNLKPLDSISATELEWLPNLPDQWSYVRFGEFIDDIQAGKSFKCDEREPLNNEIGVAKVSAVTWGEYNECESKTCLDSERINPNLFILAGDFLFSRANTIELVGASVIVRKTEKNIMLSDKTLRLKFIGGRKKYFLLFDNREASPCPWTQEIWYYDYRTNVHHTLKKKPMGFEHLEDFVHCYNPLNRHNRKPTWDEATSPEGRWRRFTYQELAVRDKTSLDLFWLKDKSLTDLDNLPEPDELAEEIIENLEAGLNSFREVLASLAPKAS